MKPMLASATEGVNLRYPVLASPKLDGVRAMVLDGRVMSRSLTPIPNLHVQKLFGKAKLNGLDGELLVGAPTAPTCFRDTMSGVMSVEGVPDVAFYVFDHVGVLPFKQRLAKAIGFGGGAIRPVEHVTVATYEGLQDFEERMLARGYEGVMLRDPLGTYKYGRSTEKEGWLLKLKRFRDSEAVVLGCVEQMHNANVATVDALGRTKRSTHKANKYGKNMLGALQVRDLRTGVEFEIGTGFDDATRAALWIAHTTAGPTVGKRGRLEPVVGRIITYTFFPTGSKDKPRFPVWKGFRDLMDL